jgi:transcriptional regulator with XRE-family HTH domain
MTGKKIKEILVENGYKLVDVAKKMGESSQNLNSMLNTQDIKTGVLERIAKAINKNLYFFLCEDTDKINQIFNTKNNLIGDGNNNVSSIGNNIGNNNEISLKSNNDEIYLHRMLEGKDVVIAELRDKIENLQKEFLVKVEAMDKRNQEIVHKSYERNKENQEQINRLLAQIEKLTDKLIK